MFATCGEVCQVWEEDRNAPIRTFEWGVDSLHDVNFNPIETHLLGKCYEIIMRTKTKRSLHIDL
jgi:WD repeat and SOF domain-containing protein 1